MDCLNQKSRSSPSDIIVKGNYDFTLFFGVLVVSPVCIICSIFQKGVFAYLLFGIYLMILFTVLSLSKKTIFYKTYICDFYIFWWEKNVIPYEDVIAIRYNEMLGAAPSDFSLFYKKKGEVRKRRFVISYKKAIVLKEWVKQSNYSIDFIGILRVYFICWV
jgi:hypothetical protein